MVSYLVREKDIQNPETQPLPFLFPSCCFCLTPLLSFSTERERERKRESLRRRRGRGRSYQMASWCVSASLSNVCAATASLSSYGGQRTRSSRSTGTGALISRPVLLRRLGVICMAPDEEKMTRRSPLDFPIVCFIPSLSLYFYLYLFNFIRSFFLTHDLCSLFFVPHI